MFSWHHEIRTIPHRAILTLCLVALAAGPIAACTGEVMEAKPVCMEAYGKGGPQIVPMYKCQGNQGGKLVNE
jgi:hypothetical protein